MIRKPRSVFDRDREWAALTSFVSDPRETATLGIVSGRRRQGKTFLLDALIDKLGGFYFEAAEATEVESLRMFGDALGEYVGAGTSLRFDNWPNAVDYLFSLPAEEPLPIVLDEFPYLTRASSALPSLIQRALDPPAQRRRGEPGGRIRLLLCGSALSVMGGLLASGAPLRGRAGLELLVPSLDYREAARFWGADDPRLAAQLHGIVGGTPAYRDQFARGDRPDTPGDFDDWVVRTVIDSTSPLFREARYLLAEETGIRDSAIYHSVLAAVAGGNSTAGGIANYVGRKTAELAHPANVLEDAGLLRRDPDAFRSGRTFYRVTEPLVLFYHAIMRRSWARLERGQGARVWRESRHRFDSEIMGPHFESLCREFALTVGDEVFGEPPGQVAAGTISDPAERAQIELDVVVFSSTAPKRILSIGECKWNDLMGIGHLDRLRRARGLLEHKGYDVGETVLACYSGAGFNQKLQAAAAEGEVALFDLARIYA